MKSVKTAIIICATMLFALSACAVDDHVEITALLGSDDFARQVEELPRLFESEEFERLFPLENFDSDEWYQIHDSIRLVYLRALLETDEDELLGDSIVDIYRSFRHRTGPALFSDLFILNPHFREKSGIIIPEFVAAYEEIAEERFFVRYMFAGTLWGLLFLNGQYDEADRLNIEMVEIAEEMLVVFEYERQFYEGEISLNDVTERLRYQVERLTESRREDGSFCFSVFTVG